MGDLIKKPYEISLWEDRLVTEDNKSYYKEVKLAVIGSNTMHSPNKAFDIVLKENINGEKTLTFSIAYRYYDELRDEFIINPFDKFLVNERKVKLYYNNEWSEFLLKERDETSEDYVFKYTAVELFSLELSKTGYDVVLDQSLNNNQGTVIELGKRALKDTDWQVDEDNSDLLQQYVKEPLYECSVTSKFQVLDLSKNSLVDINEGEKIYIFYSYIKNKIVDNVQFIREEDRNDFEIDDDYTIKSKNYRFTTPVTYTEVEGQIVINNNITVGSTYYSNQGYRLVYNILTTYDPVMNRTVDVCKAEYGDTDHEIYHYVDYTYTTSDVVMSYLTNGTNFTMFEDGQLQGWSNKTPASTIEGKKVIQPIQIVTRPEINSTKALSLIKEFSDIEGYLQIKFNGTLNSNYENTFFNSGFEDSSSFVDHITAGERFALRLRYSTGDTEHQEDLVAGAPSTINEGVRAIVAPYVIEDEEVYLDSKATTTTKIKSYKIVPSEIVLDFNEGFTLCPNLINNGTFDVTHTKYIVDKVVQTPSTSYRYKAIDDDKVYVWDSKTEHYIEHTSAYSDYYITTAPARCSYSNEQLHDPKFKMGVFLYTKDSNLVNKYIFIQDIQLTRYYEDDKNQPITIGNIPTAVSTSNDYYYLKPIEGVQQDEVTTYGSPSFLASELGISVNSIKPVYNENCEKILSIQASRTNCFDILQSLCETFECWLKIDVAHEEDGSIMLDKNKNPIKKVSFKEYAGKENFSGFKNGINLSGIERQIDSNEIVTKLIVEPVQSEYTGTGSVDIQSAAANPSGEGSIINLSYFLNQGLITNVEECNKDLLDYYAQLKEINTEIDRLNKEGAALSAALTRLESTRNGYFLVVDEAIREYDVAIEEFYELTGINYKDYAASSQDDKTKAELIDNDTVVDNIGIIYVTTATINNYSGLLTNINEEYSKLDLTYNGARPYGISIASIPGVTGDELQIDPSTQVVFDDYLTGVEFTLYTADGSSVVYQTTSNSRIFNITGKEQYTEIAFTNLPEYYGLQYFNKNQTFTLSHNNAIGVRFKIHDEVEGEVLNRRFKLIPDKKYASEHIGYRQQINDLIEQKQVIKKDFYKKYSRFLQEGTWSSQDYVDSNLYYLDALQVSNTSAQPKVSYTVNVLEVSKLDNLENYNFKVGDKTYIEDTDFFGYWYNAVDMVAISAPVTTIDEFEYKELTQLEDTVSNLKPVRTPVQEEVIVSEVEWHLDSPDEDVITVQNYKTRFEDLFQRISATVQTVQRNEITYPKTSAILNNNGLINGSLLANSISALGEEGFNLTSNGSIVTTPDGMVIRDLTNTANVIRLVGKGIQLSNDGGKSWNTAIDAEGISIDVLTAGTINTQKIWLMDGDNPSFRWDKAGLNAYGLDADGNQAYDLKTYVRFDKYGLYGIKNDEDYVAKDLEDVKDKAFFGITWDGFFIKNSYTDGEVSITSDDDFVVKQNGQNRIKIGAVEKDSTGAPTKYGIHIINDNGQVVFDTGDDGNIAITGTINAQAGNFSGQVAVGDSANNHIIIDGNSDNPTISSSNYSEGSNTGWIINGDGDATFSNVSVRGAIKTAVFEYEEIQAVGGAFLFRPSSTIKTARYVASTVPVVDEEGNPVIDEDGLPMTIDTYYHYDENTGEKVYNDLLVTVEKPLMFRENNWVKISNYNSDEAEPEVELSSFGLVHVYKVTDINTDEIPQDPIIIIDEDGQEQIIPVDPLEPTYELTLEGGCAVLDGATIENVVGGALIDFGDELGKHNYGIGVNSSDNYVNLPPRAISLFETTIHPEETTKVTYNMRGILGTLPAESAMIGEVDSKIYSNMAGTQGIYTDNMYIGDATQYLTFYTDKDGNKQLKIKASQIMFEASDVPEGEDPWKDIADIEAEGVPGPAGPAGKDGKDGEDAITVSIDSTAGVLFINNNITSTLVCTVKKGGVDITNDSKYNITYTWRKRLLDGSGYDESWGRPLNNSNTLDITASDVAHKGVFECEVSIKEA